MQEIFCQVADIALLGQDVYRVKLTSDALATLDYQGGQYLTLQVEGGRWIPFSIGNAPEEISHLELHIRLIPGHDLAEHILDQLKTTKKAHVQVPMGQCVLRQSPRESVFIVGGTGFSPVKAMIESAFAQKDERAMHLFWGAQSEGDFYLKTLAEQWQQSYEHFHFTPVISGDDKSWQGATGLVHKAALAQLSNYTQYDFYVSGSEAMVMAVYQDLLDVGVPKEQIYSDMLDIKREMGENI
ncbi:FAD-binding oxidoreductase [Pleionea sp. CnH1-48]|uniref:NAD(P)H-flavin reductase n=1 Tax=Pleionea sp. CnH1-48 TaxID=2954494 RepID=UPI002096BFA1|nr:NAD(P)H-flavin reductase [Pleionea sp. CnH1-48]